MLLAHRIPRPAVKRIVKRESCIELNQVVLVHAGQAKRCGKQTGSLRREVELRGIRAAHDDREAIKCLAVQAEFLDHHIEGAKTAAVTPENATLDVERRRLKPVCDIDDLGRRYEQEDGRRIDKAANEP